MGTIRRSPVSTREPKVWKADVRLALLRSGSSAVVLAHRAKVSSRTVYRILDSDDRTYGEWLRLELADPLLVAAERSLEECRLKWS